MKRIFYGILVFYLLLHILGPYLAYVAIGYSPFFAIRDVSEAIPTAFWLNFLSVMLALVFVASLPPGRRTLDARIGRVSSYYYFAIVYSVAAFYYLGGFRGILGGAANGSAIGYLNMFMDLNAIMLILLAMQEANYSIILVFGLFVVGRTMTGSRSAFISLIPVVIAYVPFANFRRHKAAIFTALIVLAIVSPVLFLAATSIRKSSVNDIEKLILARVSYLETGAMAIEAKGRIDAAIFYEKYDLANQVKLVINSLIPGDLFPGDVDPNQYYRSAFMGFTREEAHDNYTSMNMTLPVFLFMYLGFFGAIIVCAAILVIYYLLMVISWPRHKAIFISLVLSLYGLLTFFDFVMFVRGFLTYMLTAFFCLFFSRLGGQRQNSVGDLLLISRVDDVPL
jgi:hypothetical protein